MNKFFLIIFLMVSVCAGAQPIHHPHITERLKNAKQKFSNTDGEFVVDSLTLQADGSKFINVYVSVTDHSTGEIMAGAKGVAIVKENGVYSISRLIDAGKFEGSNVLKLAQFKILLINNKILVIAKGVNGRAVTWKVDKEDMTN